MFYISQIKDDDCGFASLKMLLADIFKSEDYLYLKQDEEHGPYNYFELIDIAKEYGVVLSGVKAIEKENFGQWDHYPFITTISVNENLHAVMVSKKKGKKIYVLDPARGPMWMKIDDFIKIWDGTILKIDEVAECTDKPENVLKKFDNLKKYKFTLQFVQLMVSIFFLFFLFFLGSSLPEYVSIIFFCLYLVGEIIFRHIILKLTSDFDNIVLNELTSLPKDNYLFINRLNDYKQNFLTSKISIISNIILVSSLIFMMVFNGLLNAIIVFAVIILCLIDSFIIKPYLAQEEKEIARKETLIFKSDNLGVFRENFTLVNKLTTRYARKVMLFKSLKLILMAVTAGLVLYFSGYFEAINILFYVTISMCLERGMTALFEIAENQKENNLARAKLNNLITRN